MTILTAAHSTDEQGTSSPHDGAEREDQPPHFQKPGCCDSFSADFHGDIPAHNEAQTLSSRQTSASLVVSPVARRITDRPTSLKRTTAQCTAIFRTEQRHQAASFLEHEGLRRSCIPMDTAQTGSFSWFGVDQEVHARLWLFVNLSMRSQGQV